MKIYDTYTECVIIVKKVYLGNDHIYKFCNCINKKNDLYYLVMKK